MAAAVAALGHRQAACRWTCRRPPSCWTGRAGRTCCTAACPSPPRSGAGPASTRHAASSADAAHVAIQERHGCTSADADHQCDAPQACTLSADTDRPALCRAMRGREACWEWLPIGTAGTLQACLRCISSRRPPLRQAPRVQGGAFQCLQQELLSACAAQTVRPAQCGLLVTAAAGAARQRLHHSPSSAGAGCHGRACRCDGGRAAHELQGGAGAGVLVLQVLDGARAWLRC